VNDELTPVLLVVAIGIAFIAVIVFFARRRNAKLRDVLLPLMTSAGWSDLRPMFLVRTGLRGTWRSLPAEIAYGMRNRQTPERLILSLGVRSQTRLVVKRRMHGFWTRPFTLWGPPLVELQRPDAQQFWIRSDEVVYADRVFGDDNLVKLIGENLVVAFDEIRMDGNGIRIKRAIDERGVREKYNLAAFRLTFDPQRFMPIAREEIELAQALAGKVA
jgi:hypothetical protein